MLYPWEQMKTHMLYFLQMALKVSIWLFWNYTFDSS